MKIQIYFSILLTVMLLFSGCNDYFDNFFTTDKDENAGFFDEDIISITKYINENKQSYSKFDTLLKVTNIDKALNSYNPNGNNFTLFLPTDEAFENYISNHSDYDSFDEILNDLEFAVELVRYHIVMGEIQTSFFPYGALPDSTASGDYLTIGFDFGYDTLANEILYDSTVYKVNNEAPLVQYDIKLINGYIHVIDMVLEPPVLNSYEWLKKQKGFGIISKAFEITGLKDTMDIFRSTESGTTVPNVYTLLVEHDSIYHKNGIYTIDDLIERIVDDPSMSNYQDVDNPLYQYAAYHILENLHFLDAFITSNYNTFATFPVRIDAGLELRINPGKRIYDFIVHGSDTTYIDYIDILYNQSNVLTKNGAIHFIDQMLELSRPRPSVSTFQFTDEEPVINKLRNVIGEHPFFTDDEFESIHWEGVDVMHYVKATDIDGASRNDYIRFDGDFSVEYKIPKVLPATYRVWVRANAQSYQNASIQVFIDGKRLGSNFDLKTGGSPYSRINVGSVSFSSYSEHTIVIKTLIPGRFEWDYIQFEPL